MDKEPVNQKNNIKSFLEHADIPNKEELIEKARKLEQVLKEVMSKYDSKKRET